MRTVRTCTCSTLNLSGNLKGLAFDSVSQTSLQHVPPRSGWLSLHVKGTPSSPSCHALGKPVHVIWYHAALRHCYPGFFVLQDQLRGWKWHQKECILVPQGRADAILTSQVSDKLSLKKAFDTVVASQWAYQRRSVEIPKGRCSISWAQKGATHSSLSNWKVCAVAGLRPTAVTAQHFLSWVQW